MRKARVSFEELITLQVAVATKYDHDPTLKSRNSDIVNARVEFFGRAYDDLGVSTYCLAKLYNFHHTTIIHHIRKWREKCQIYK